MAFDGHLKFDTRIELGGFRNGIRNMGGEMKGLNSTVTNLGRALRGLAAHLAKWLSLAALIRYGKQCIELASDMQEVQNVVDTAFGDMAYKMEQFADTAIRSFGISRLAAKQTGSTFAAMASGMGLAQGTATDMAIALTALSADMASFYNKGQDVTAAALKSVFTGETESLKQFGIVMSEVNLTAWAMEHGITKSISAMSQAEKVTLRYNYIMEQTALAHGDFARTSEGWANQIRILSEQFKEFSTVIGNVLMQTLLPVIRALNKALSALTTYATNAYNALAALFGWEIMQSCAGAVTAEIAESVEEQNALTEAVNETAEAQKNALAGFDRINKLSDSKTERRDTGTTGGTITPVVSPYLDTTGAEAAAEKAADKIGSMFGGIDLRPLTEAFERLKQAAAPLTEKLSAGLSWLLEHVLMPLGKWTMEEAGPAALDVLSGALNVLDAAAEALKPYGEWLWEHFLQPLGEWAGTIVTTGLELLADVLNSLGDWIREHPDAAVRIGAVAGAVAALSAAISGGAIAAAVQAISEAFAGLAAVDVTIGVIIAGIISWGYVITELSANWEDLCDVFRESGGTFGFLSGWITSASDDVEGFFDQTDAGHEWRLFWESVGETVVDYVERLKAFWSGWVDAFEEAGGMIYDKVEELKSWFSMLWEGIVILFQGAPDWFSDQFEAAKQGVVNAFAPLKKWASDQWNVLSKAFSLTGRYFKEKFQQAWKNITEAFSRIRTWASDRWRDITNIFQAVPGWFSDTFAEAWRKVTEAFAALGRWFGDRWGDVKSALSGVGGWFGQMFGTAYTAVQSVFSGIGSWFTDRWKNITEAFKGAPEWFRDIFQRSWDSVTRIFSGAQDWFRGIWSGISNGAKEGANWIIDRINDLLGRIQNGLHNLADAISRTCSFSIPQWVPGIGGTSFALNMPRINIGRIPRLASGTVVPAHYGEFLAMLGDNRREPEVVSPLSTIEQAVENALSRSILGGDIHLTVDLDGKKIYRNIVRRNQESMRMTGRNPLLGGDRV